MQSEYPIPGLEHEVEILIDEWGVPHIYAESQRDAFIAQGFTAARDRLFQIDLARRRGLGLLAEVFGAAYLEQDRAARLFLYRGDMRAEWLAYGSDAKAVTTAFTTGVNAYVNWALEDRSRLAPEFELLGYQPSLWRPEDIATMRTHGLFFNAEQELARAMTIRDFGTDVENLRRAREPEVELQVPEGLDLGVLRDEILHTYRLAIAPAVFDEAGVELRASFEPGGSNNWVIAGTRTASGRPILASDPHRAITMPSLRYVAHLSAPGLNVIGGGEPGLPGISIGHNGQVAFGLTVFMIDQEDLYVYETNPEDPSLYLYNGRWEPMRLEGDTIDIAGETSETVELRFTRHGPVIFEDPDAHVAVALRAAWLEPGMAPYLGSMDYMRAGTCDEFVVAMNRWGSPGENQLYASPDGTIGWQPAGLVPIRPNWDGTMPVPGDGRYEWDGFYDLDILPNARNPERGWLASANQYNLPPDYPNAEKTVTYDWSAGFRYQRIVEALEENDRFSIEDCVALQTDYLSLPAREIVALLRHLPEAESSAPQAFTLLTGWDGREDAASAAAGLFEIWYRRHVRPRLLREFLSKAGLKDTDLARALGTILPKDDRSSDPRIDLRLLRSLNPDSADGRATLHEVLVETLPPAFAELRGLLGDDISSWSWGRLHHSSLAHPFRSKIAEPDSDWTLLGPLPRGGSADCVGATGYSSDFNQTGGATFRIVIDVGEWDNSVFMNSPGQSSDPRSPHYADLFPLWAGDESVPLLYSRAAVNEHVRSRIRLLPIGVEEPRLGNM
jgi:penicillin amidase